MSRCVDKHLTGICTQSLNRQSGKQRDAGRFFDETRQYLIVGGYAVAFHGYPRYTKDIDIFYANDEPNISRLCEALREFAFSESDLAAEQFRTPGTVVTFGVEPVRVDLLNQIDGVTFELARRGQVFGNYGEAKVRFIGKEELILKKTSTKRLRDKADAEELR